VFGGTTASPALPKVVFRILLTNPSYRALGTTLLCFNGYVYKLPATRVLNHTTSYKVWVKISKGLHRANSSLVPLTLKRFTTVISNLKKMPLADWIWISLSIRNLAVQQRWHQHRCGNFLYHRCLTCNQAIDNSKSSLLTPTHIADSKM